MRFLTARPARPLVPWLWRQLFKPKVVQRLLAGPTGRAWPMVVLVAATAAACGGGGTGTATQPLVTTATSHVAATATAQPAATLTPQPTATVETEPSVGARLSAASADGSVQFQILVSSESTFELRSVVISIDAQRSCGYQHALLPVIVTMSPTEAGAISDGGLEFHGSQPLSVASQSADYHGNLTSTLKGSAGLSISGKFTGAKRAEGVFRFAGGPVLTASFAPSGGGPAETVTLSCDTGEISWTAK